MHDALKALARLNHGVPIVKLRAFVAGSGDLRRVKDIVAEDLTDKKQALPAVSTIQVGALAHAWSASGDRSGVFGKESGESKRGRVCSRSRKRQCRGCRGAAE